jgi:hypothetical protein
MKSLSASLLALLITAVAAPHLAAQEPASGLGLMPAAPPAKPESLLPEGQPLQLIPEMIPPATKPDDKDAKEKKSKASAAEDALRDQIKLRVAKTKAKEDPELQAIWDSHYTAPTDYAQRRILTRYYTLLCERIAKVDKTIKPEVIEALRISYANDYAQSRIQPTEQPKNYVDPWPAKPASKATPKAKR